MNGIRRFEKEDWMAFGGCEEFYKNSEPFIAEKTIESDKDVLTIIADKNGVEIELLTTLDGKEECYIWRMEKSLTPTRAVGEMNAVINKLAKYNYSYEICYALDHKVCKEFEDYEMLD